MAKKSGENQNSMENLSQLNAYTGPAYIKRDDDLSWSKIFAWLCIYLIAAGFLSTTFAVLILLNTLFPIEPMSTLVKLFALVVPLVLMGIGVVSILPQSEYYYMRGAGYNPAIARETMAHIKRKPERREFGVLIGVAGITFLLRISPWDLFFNYVGQVTGVLMVTIVMIVAFILLVLYYRRQVSGSVKFDNR